MFRKLFCLIGLHKWLYIKSESTDTIRCDIREKLYGKYMGRTSYTDDSVTDRVCARCRKEDFNIQKTKERILKEEAIIFEYAKKI